MDLLHSWGVELAVHLQTRYSNYQDLFNVASKVADLHTTFFFFFPVWFHLRRDTGLRLIWVAVLGDWLNLVLKWVLFGERPYWWLHETRFYSAGPASALQQFPITCETGPGSPSGHAMGAAVGGVQSLNSPVPNKPLNFKSWGRVRLWMLMGLVELLVCMSRVYMAAHFPHQVIAGAITGESACGEIGNYFYTTFLLTAFAVGFYLLLKALGVDLLWTLEKAQRWCVKPEWVHLDTTPFASLLRNMGTLFGLGLGLHSPLYTETRKKASTSFKMGCITVSLLLLWLLDEWTFSSENLVTFYFLSFGKSAIALLIPTTLVPWALCWICKGRREDKKL
uniref:glucose-6-phosphatase n=1 Tax=Mola mola TaxID=94237 RepID=A0A3Q3X9I3_MOLML